MAFSFERLGRALACVAMAGSTVACATVTRGTKEGWTITSVPPGASAVLSNGLTCPSTPCTFKLPRNDAFDVTVTKPGYKPYTGRVTHELATGGGVAFAGNVVIGGLIGGGLDAMDGSTQDLKPDPMIATLVVADTVAPESASEATTPAVPEAAPAATPAVKAAAPAAAEAPAMPATPAGAH